LNGIGNGGGGTNNIPKVPAKNKEQMIETKPKKAYDIPREILKDNERQRRVYDPSGKSPTVLARSDSPKITTPKQVGVATDIKGHDQIKRVYSPDGKSPTVTTCGGGHREPKVALNELPDKSQTIKSQYYKSSRANFERQGTFHATGVQQEDLTWRKLTCLEAERLQTVPDNYTNHVSNTQRYKMLGNGWTVEVIKHIYKNMEYENDSKS
jgi:site-specific DNA-cytosine methylase